MEIVIELDQRQTAELERMMEETLEFGHDIKNPVSKSAFYMLNSVMKNFREQGRPDKWAEWSKNKSKRNALSYSEWREHIRKPKGILKLAVKWGKFIRATDLMKSINVAEPNAEGVLLRAGDNAPYAAMHQFGSADGDVPARPFLLFQDEDVEKILTIFEKALKAKIEGDKTEEGK